MISVNEARQKLMEAVSPGKIILTELDGALGRILAEDVKSPICSPHFDNSAMDGFALRAADTANASRGFPVKLKVRGLIAAGEVSTHVLQTGECLRIMTGAALPAGADTVVPQELVLQDADGSIVLHQPCEAGAHIRTKGEEVRTGEVALEKGVKLCAASLSFLAGLGVCSVPVFAAPDLRIIPTGSELVTCLEDLSAGKIIESNSIALKHAMQALHVQASVSLPIPDRRDDLLHELRGALLANDVVLLCGGVSVGVYDLVKSVLAELGVEEVFWGVQQKPGKPLFVGRCKDTLIFGLPGNPAASLMCCYEYVIPALRRMMGYKNPWLQSAAAECAQQIIKRDQREHFLRAWAWYDQRKLFVRLAGEQDSHRMQSFAHANCLLVVPSECHEIKAGEKVEIHWLPE